MQPWTRDALLALQGFQVLFLALHDWIPLGRLNDLEGVHAADNRDQLIRVTIISTVPFAIGFAASLIIVNHMWPAWLMLWLRISYAVLFVGALRAWWIPYLVAAEPARADRYRVMFGRTHAFLPERNGITPNTLHVILHAAILATLVLLFLPV